MVVEGGSRQPFPFSRFHHFMVIKSGSRQHFFFTYSSHMMLIKCGLRQPFFSLPFLSKLLKVAQSSSFHFEAPLHVAEVVGDFKKRRKVDNRPLCTHCSKPGHSIADCWMKYPDKKKFYHSKGRGPSQPAFPLNNVTAASLQAMPSKAVDNIRSPANKS